MINPKQFKWTGATERTDGTPYLPTDRKGYDVSIRQAGESRTANIVLGVISQTQDFVMPIVDLANPPAEGDWLLAVREVDSGGRVSAWSDDLPFSVVVAVPKSPTGLAAL